MLAADLPLRIWSNQWTSVGYLHLSSLSFNSLFTYPFIQLYSLFHLIKLLVKGISNLFCQNEESVLHPLPALFPGFDSVIHSFVKTLPCLGFWVNTGLPSRCSNPSYLIGLVVHLFLVDPFRHEVMEFVEKANVDQERLIHSLLCFYLFVFFGCLVAHGVSRPGSDRSCSWDLCCGCSIARSFNPLARDQTCVLALQRCHRSYCATAGTPQVSWL